MSEIRAGLISDAAGTGPINLTKQWASKALLNYDQTVPTILHDQNVTSVTDVSAGLFNLNFTNSFATSNYVVAAVVSGSDPNRNMIISGEASNIPSIKTTSALRMETGIASSGTPADLPNSNTTVTGDLA